MSISDIKKQAVNNGELSRLHNIWLIKDSRAHSEDRRDGKFHPSSISGCPTATALDLLGLSEGTNTGHDAKSLRIFDMGTAIHRLLQSQYIRMGIVPFETATVDGKQTSVYYVEVPIDIPEWGMVGHVDAVVELNGKRFVVEIKSVNSNRWAKMTGPEEHHKLQAACYVKGCEKLLNGSKDVIFIYYSKDTSEIKEYVVSVTDKEYNLVTSKRTAINIMMDDYNKRKIIPAPSYEDANKPPCRYCPWKAKCHSTLDREAWIASLKEKHRAVEAPNQADIRATPSLPRRLPTRQAGKV